MSSEIYGSCNDREVLWQSWVDARCALRGAQGTVLKIVRSEERTTRNALNTHMVKHDCGRPVDEPEIAIAANAS
jgi:hypothetical protein